MYSISQKISNSTRNTHDVTLRTSLQKICSINSSLQFILPIQHKCCYTMQCSVSPFHVDGTFYMHSGRSKEFLYQYLCIASVCYSEHVLVLPFHQNALHVQNTNCSQCKCSQYLFYLSLPFFLANSTCIDRTESTPPTPETPSHLHLVLFWKEIGLTTLTSTDYSHASPCEEITASALLPHPVSTWPFGDPLGAQPGCLSSPDSCFPNTCCVVGDRMQTPYLPFPCDI